ALAGGRGDVRGRCAAVAADTGRGIRRVLERSLPLQAYARPHRPEADGGAAGEGVSRESGSQEGGGVPRLVPRSPRWAVDTIQVAEAHRSRADQAPSGRPAGFEDQD